MASVPVYCLCRLPYDVTRFMIECDICQDWFHGSCVRVEESKAAEIDLYHCPDCQVTHGPSVMKKRRGCHKQEAVGSGFKEPHRPVQTGSLQFIKELHTRVFPSADEVVLKPSGSQLTVEYLEENTFSVPILVTKKEGLGMRLPPSSFSVNDVVDHIGADKEIDVIDVSRQADCKMKLGDFVRYYNSPERDKVLNVISLEFSETRLSNLIETPKIVRKLSWVENLWPEEAVFERPNVQKYCLMGVKDSYTDFHIDFGGTSVWYHVLRGEKIFYLIRPSPANLTLFEKWSSSSNQNEMFFGDQVDTCYRCSVKQGHTLFIPTGWIHSVLTPVDCLAFGGNFLHSLNIEMQLRAYEIEKRLSTADLFRFPNFETVCWYVGKHLLDTFRGLRENRRHPAGYLVHGAKALNNAFRVWTRGEALTEHEEEIPETIKTQQLVKDLAKEIQLVEDIFQQNLGKTGAPFGALRGPQPSQASPSSSSGRPPGRRRGSKAKESPTAPTNPSAVTPGKKRGRKSKESLAAAAAAQTAKTPGGAAELDLLEIHTKHTLKKFQGNKQPCKAKIDLPASCLGELEGEINESKLQLILTNGKILSKKGVKSTSGSARFQPLLGPLEGVGGVRGSFEYDSEEDLQIDETPKRKRRPALSKKKLAGLPRKLPRAKPCSDPNKIREPGEVEFDIEEDYTTDEDPPTMHDGKQGGAGGILDLLKASKQVGGLDPAALSEDAPASPSTQEAIQGMLSMANLQSSSSSGAGGAGGGGAAWWGGGAERGGGGASSQSGKARLVVQRPGKRPVKRPARRDSDAGEDSVDEQETLGTCFKDSEYIYPSLESDEDDPALKSKSRKKKNSDDAPWSPKARVVPTLPKQNRPVREGARVASIETGLAAAAAKLAQQEQQKTPKRKYVKKRSAPKEPAAPQAVQSPPLQSGGAVEQESCPSSAEELVTEPRLDLFSGSLADHEYTAGPSAFGLGGQRGTTPMAPGVFLNQRRGSSSSPQSSGGPPATPTAPGQAGKRPKKGQATAKQRLGKILKIHRNGKLLL